MGFDKDRQTVDLIGEFDFAAYIAKNNKDLNIHVVHVDGRSIEDAEVKVNGKKLSYHSTLQLYTLEKTNKKGILSVEYQGKTVYYQLNRSINNPLIRRVVVGGLNASGVRFVVTPVIDILSLPVDEIKSVKNYHATGSVFRIKNFFQKSYDKIACIFDDYYCENKYSSVFLFNKPIYKPGDTVYYKLFIASK